MNIVSSRVLNVEVYAESFDKIHPVSREFATYSFIVDPIILNAIVERFIIGL